MDFIFKKTADLTTEQCQELMNLFHLVFNKEKSLDKFKRQFLNTATGYSYHGLMSHNGAIVGAYSAIPYRYTYFGKPVLLALAVDTMIHPEHQGGPFNVKKMADLVYAALKQDGIPFVLGFPNENIFKYRLKVLKWHHLGDLSYYALPLQATALHHSLFLTNPMFRALANLWIHAYRHRSAPSLSYGLQKINDTNFREHRYGPEYETLALPHEGSCTFRIHAEDNGSSVAYMLDVDPLNSKTFHQAVRHIYKNVAGKADLIMYVGKLPFHPQGLVTIPKKLEPKPVHFCGKILLPKIVDERILDIGSWNINLSNFDVR